MIESVKPDKVEIHCPECGKRLLADRKPDGAVAYKCYHCKIVGYSKKHAKEKLIKVKYM